MESIDYDWDIANNWDDNAGSNPAPATKSIKIKAEQKGSAFFVSKGNNLTF